MNESELTLRGICKAFGPFVASDQVTLEVSRGSIHALIGENGAGKSTVAKIMAGVLKPDSGEMTFRGKPVRWSSAREAARAGIGMVHQHFMLAQALSDFENAILGAEDLYLHRVPSWLRPFMPIPRKKLTQQLSELAKQAGLSMDWGSTVEELPIGIQQRLEIIKVLFRRSEFLIFDEPTAVLAPQEIEIFFEVLRKFRAQGKTIVIITHKLKEVMQLTDSVTVFRQGKNVGTFVTRDTTIDQLAHAMVGRAVDLGHRFPKNSKKPEKTLLEVADLNDRSGKLCGVNLTVGAGEILGVAGIDGNGQSELFQSILLPSSRKSGRVRLLDCEVMSSMSAAQVRELGVGVIPEDRLVQGLLPALSVLENYALGRTPRWISWGLLKLDLAEQLERWDVRPRRMERKVGSLSGGNQQKVLFAREFRDQPGFLLIAQPTRGVDLGAMELLHEQIIEAKNRGVGILLVSSELEELLKLCDRIVVMQQGKIVREFAGDAVGIEHDLGLALGGSIA